MLSKDRNRDIYSKYNELSKIIHFDLPIINVLKF